jgi:hypothetical protein
MTDKGCLTPRFKSLISSLALDRHPGVCADCKVAGDTQPGSVEGIEKGPPAHSEKEGLLSSADQAGV